MISCFFIANNNIGASGLSGGDRIFIELARAWKDKFRLAIVGCAEAIAVAQREGLDGIVFHNVSEPLPLGDVFTLRAIFKNFFFKLAQGLKFVFKNKKLFEGRIWLYSVSDFYPDFLPAFLIKITNKEAFWIAGFYLLAPPPWQQDSPYRGREWMRGFLYWLSQRFSQWAVSRFADMIFVTSDDEKEKFLSMGKTLSADKVIVVRGGVDVAASTAYLENSTAAFLVPKKYDACFVGRFHPQKGVLELIDIWKRVVEMKKDARLAMVGNGPLESAAAQKTRELKLESHIDFFGFLDGKKKFEIFKNSRIILHPAIFDSGGMAAAEAMAWGLPGVSFDLKALRTYYPKGMMKIRPYDFQGFADAVIRLLTDRDFYADQSQQARKLILDEWDWNIRARQIHSAVMAYYNRRNPS